MSDLMIILSAANEADTRAMIALSCMIPFAVLMFGVIEMVSRFKKRKNEKTVSIEIPAEYDLPVWKFKKGDLIRCDDDIEYFEVVQQVPNCQALSKEANCYTLLGRNLATRDYLMFDEWSSTYFAGKNNVERNYRKGGFKDES